MRRALYDLHTHTTASDGRLSPRELVRQAAARKLRAFAVTDHDTVDGIDEASSEAASLGVELIPGIEVSASCEGASIHILGLFICHKEPWLQEFFAQARERRVERVQRIVEKLGREGIELSVEDVLAKSTHGTVGRPHVAEVLIERGVVTSMAEAFDRYLGQKAPAYVGYEKITCAEAIELIQRAGGVASLAHPGLLDRNDLIPKIIASGLQALEAFHSDHTPEATKACLDIARQNGLLVTGGSDFHAPDGTTRGLGCPELTSSAIDRLRDACRR